MSWFLLSLSVISGCGARLDADFDGFSVSSDCNDRDADVHPGADEVCDGVDNDCDGYTDAEDAIDASEWFLDYDGDGYAAEDFAIVACDRPVGFMAVATDCDDMDSAVHPGAREKCDGLDNDCDGLADGGLAVDAPWWYRDADRDSHGDPDDRLRGCVQPMGYVETASDCDDSDPATNQEAPERCDDEDNDCDGQVDEDDAVDAPNWFDDNDGDGYGRVITATRACAEPTGMASSWGDCNDADAAIHPDAEEVCGDGVDNDCDHSDDGCDPAGDWSLADASAVLLGITAYDAAGASLAGVGDVDGDGLSDALIGMAGDDTRGSSAGAAALARGPIKGEDTLARAHAMLLGRTAGDRAGAAVSGGGDLDGDGYAELIVGAPGTDRWAEDGGVAYLVSGPVSGTVGLASADGRVFSWSEEAEAGAAVAHAGDVDRDGLADVLVGAPGAAVAWLVLGPATGSISDAAVTATLWGYDTGALAGQAVAGAGDVDADGYADLLVADPYDGARGAYAGVAYLVSGPVSGAIDLDHDTLRLQGQSAGDGTGYDGVAGAGDVNGDGYGDVLIGAYGRDGAAVDVGAAWLVSGPVTASGTVRTAGLELGGGSLRGYAGAGVAGLGDVNGDGYGDLMVGARGVDVTGTDAGAAWLVYGPLTGDMLLSGASLALFGESAGDKAGGAVAAAGDLDSDGFNDVLIGASGAQGNGEGAAYVLLGGGI